MTVREKLEEVLVNHGLWPEEASIVFELMLERSVQGDGLGEVKWNDSAEAYPAQLLAVVLLILKERAVEWIDANKPKHFARVALAHLPAGREVRRWENTTIAP